MQPLRFKAVYLIGLIGLFSSAVHAEDAAVQDKGVILDLDALQSLKKAPAGQDASQTTFVVAYDSGAVKPSEAEVSDIEKVAAATRNNKARLSIVAYAPTAEGENENDARRLALRRAIALRQILVAAGVDGSRVNLQPMGVHPDGPGNSDQAQIILRQP